MTSLELTGRHNFKQSKATLRKAAKMINAGRDKKGVSKVDVASRQNVTRNLRIVRKEMLLAAGTTGQWLTP